MNYIWLASYPRSGNTFLRTILWHCFNLRSASIYPNDLGGNKQLEIYVGHVEHAENGKIMFPENELPIIKTHEVPKNTMPAIYVVRDGRAASVSLWEFYKKSISLASIVSGATRFGTWANHIDAWSPWSRPNTLVLRYEDISSDIESSLDRLSSFLGKKIITSCIPPRESIATADGQWVRNKSNWEDKISSTELDLFYHYNGEMMKKIGYIN